MSFLTPEPSSTAALLKIAALLTTGLSVHLALSPPNPPAPPTHRIVGRTLFERCVRWVTFCSKMMVWTATSCDILATAAYARPTPVFVSVSSFFSPDPAPLASLHPLLALGALATLLGAAVRLTCFRELGTLFTFELSISPAHTLITSGPYRAVRHPSYTGIYLTLLGASAVALAPGAWFRECALGAHSPGVALVAWAVLAFWSTKVWYALRSTNRRLNTEDTELRRVFGKTWETYAARVRWRLLPGVY
ncbi:hypothetical protein B0H21DRAFT_710914 [Amylocystis lapponica]|nr:hypothetical protein B0H21DRAFT_710914 [Amylocystis lapponica]